MSRVRRYLRAPRKLRFSRDGRWFVGMTILVGFGAINTGNNLLYLLLGMMLGLIIVSGILSERVLRRVTVRRQPHGDLFVGSPMHLSYEITNDKKFFSSYSIEVAEHESRPTRARRRVAIGLPELRPRKRKDREQEGDPGGPKALSLHIPAKSSKVTVAEYTFPQRGLYHYVGIDLITRFPFGFFEKTRPIEESYEMLVYPEIRRDTEGFVRRDILEGEIVRHAEGRSGDFFGLREYREGEDRRDVHWKVSARRNKLVRRLYEREDNEAVAVHLYNHVDPDLEAGAEKMGLALVEEAITKAATLCAALTQSGHRFSLITIDERVDEGAGPGQLKTCLRHLALLKIRRDETQPMLELSRAANRVLFAPRGTPQSIIAGFSQVVDVSELNEAA